MGLVDWREACFAGSQPIDRVIYFFFGIDKDEKNYRFGLPYDRRGVKTRFSNEAILLYFLSFYFGNLLWC